MKSLKKAALDFNPVLDTISPTLHHSPSQIYGLPAHSAGIETPPKKWYQFILNGLSHFYTNIKQAPSLQCETRSKPLPSINTYRHDITTQPLIIKATTRISNTFSGKQPGKQLLGKTVLCVGGHTGLYSDYGDSIKAWGGSLSTFHGSADDSIEYLYTLLSEADMVICPIDCVRHELFFAVKYFCKHTNKRYVVLDRSEINTFRKGVEVLAQIH